MSSALKLLFCFAIPSIGLGTRVTRGLSTLVKRALPKDTEKVADGWFMYYDPEQKQHEPEMYLDPEPQQQHEFEASRPHFDSMLLPEDADGRFMFHDPEQKQHEREPLRQHFDSHRPISAVAESSAIAEAVEPWHGTVESSPNAFADTDNTDYNDYNDYNDDQDDDPRSTVHDSHVYDSLLRIVNGLSRIESRMDHDHPRDYDDSYYRESRNHTQYVDQIGKNENELLPPFEDVSGQADGGRPVSSDRIGHRISHSLGREFSNDQYTHNYSQGVPIKRVGKGVRAGNVGQTEAPEPKMKKWSPISFLRSCVPLVSSSLEIVGQLAMAIPPPAGLVAGGTMMFAGAILETGDVDQEGEEKKITTFQNAIDDSFKKLRPQLLQIDSRMTEILKFVKVVESHLYAMDGKLNDILDLVQDVYEHTVLGRDKLQEINQLYVGLMSRLKVISMEGAGALDWRSFKNWLDRLSPETLSRNWGPLSSDNLEVYLLHMAKKVGDCDAAQSYHTFAATRIKLFGLKFIREVVLFGNTAQSRQLVRNLKKDFKRYDAILRDLNLDHAVRVDSSGVCQDTTTTTTTITQVRTTTTTTRFVLGNPNTNVCPNGSYPINNRLKCYWAAVQFKESYSSLYYKQRRRPSGCYTDGRRVRFNIHSKGASEVGYRPLCDSQPDAPPPFDLHDKPGSGTVSGNMWIQSKAWSGVRGSYPMCASGDQATGARYKFRVHITRGTYHQIGVAKKQCCQHDKTSVGEGHDSYNFAALNSLGWERNHGAAKPLGRPSTWWNGTWNGAPRTVLVTVDCRKRSFKVVMEGSGELLGKMTYPKPSAGKVEWVNGVQYGWDPYGESRWDGIYAFVGGQSSDQIAELSWVEAQVTKKSSKKWRRRLYRRR